MSFEPRFIFNKVWKFLVLFLLLPFRHTYKFQKVLNFFGAVDDLLMSERVLQMPKGLRETKICIVLHVYYVDVLDEIIKKLNQFTVPFDLFVSVSPHVLCESLRQILLENLSHVQNLQIESVPNRGRDCAPFCITFGPQIIAYDLCLKIHTKKTLHGGDVYSEWRSYLFDRLCGSSQRIKQILYLFDQDPSLGLVYALGFYRIPASHYSWGANHEWGGWLKKKLNLEVDLFASTLFSFPTGTMFWFRPESLRPLLESKISINDFELEGSQVDGCLHHAIERIIPFVAMSQGFGQGLIGLNSQNELFKVSQQTGWEFLRHHLVKNKTKNQ